MKKLLLYIATAMVFLMSSGCSIFLDSDYKNSTVYYMSLERMFPDESVRALAKAAGQGRVKTIESLVDSGVDVNSSGTLRATPLFWTTRKRNYKGFKKLLELGANPNADHIPLDFHGYTMGGIGRVETIMHHVADMNDPRFLKAALQHGGDPNIVNKGSWSGEAPIFRIILLWGTLGKSKKKDMERIDILLEAGANIDAQNDFGKTPVMEAYSPFLNADLILFLLDRGADYDTIKDLAGLTLVNMVANDAGKYTPKGELKRLKVVEWLESRGVVMDKKEPLPIE